jgi:hypothetical protein
MRDAAAPSRTSIAAPARRYRALLGALAVSCLAAACVATAAVPAPAGAAVRPGAPARACSAESFTWTGDGDETTWGNVKNWSPSNRAPGSCSGDSVDIPVEANITGMPAASFADFTIDATAGSDGTLTGGPITVTGHFEWDGSGIEATVNLPAGATGTIAGPANNKDLGGSGLGIPGTLNVSGTLNLDALSGDGGSLGIGAGIGQGLIQVQPGGTLTANGENDLSGASCCGGTENPTLTNDGTIDITSGRIFTEGVVLNQLGAVQVAAGALLDSDSPTQLGAASSYSGAGQLLLDISANPDTIAGTLSLGTGFQLNLGPQACLEGTGTIDGPGTFEFTGGNLAAALTIAKGALMHVTGPGGKNMSTESCGTADGTVVNHGKILVDQGTLSFGSSGMITNDKGADLSIAPGATLTTDSCCGTKKLLINHGTLQVTAPPPGVASGTPAAIEPVPLDNTGTISVASGQELLLNGAPATFASGTSLTGPGTALVQEPVTASGTVTAGTGTTLDLDQNGSVDGIFSLAGSGALHWTGGAISGTVSVPSTIAVSISGAVAHSVVNRPNGQASVLTTRGPVSIAAGTAATADSVQVGEGDQWVNAGTLTLAKQAAIGAPSCCGSTAGLDNTGAMTLSAGGATDDVTAPVVNSGTLKLASGILAMTAGTYQQTSSGTLAVNFAGTSPGTGFGQLNVTGAVTLAGKLLVSTSGGFTPPSGKPFAVLAYQTHSGKFTTLSGSPSYTVAYHATSMDVVFS